ncbi:MAG: radical SAM protein [Candidatus Omnitrophica bacterium]|nr:radical SAM protein [Candidatus Omnitrophota bacterium]
MKRVLCINPPAGKIYGKTSRDGRCQSEEGTWTETFPPTTLTAIAGHIRSRGYEVGLIDCIGNNISWKGLGEKVTDFSPNVVIINTVTPTIKEDLEVALLVKRLVPDCITAAYGTMPSALPEEIRKIQPALDYCIRGDPETPALMIADGKEPPQDVWIEPDLDNLAIPAYELLPTYHFPLNDKRWTFLIDGKGCPYRCTFCVEGTISEHKARYKSLDRVMEEIDYVVRKHRFPYFMFWDELFTLNIERSTEICKEIIKRGYNREAQWMITTRVDKADESLFELMKKAGCWMVVFGIESGNQNVLNAVKKDITIEQSRKAVEIAKKYKLKTVGHFILGLPGSSVETDRQTIEFSKSLPLDFAQFYCCTAFPGSELYDWAVEEKLLAVNTWEGIEQGTANIKYPHYSADIIQKMRQQAYREFYWRPIFWWRFLQCLSLKAILKVIPRGVRFLGWMKK